MLNSGFGNVQLIVDGFPPTVIWNVLAEVTQWVEEADADERNAEITGFFGMVAGQDALPPE